MEVFDAQSTLAAEIAGEEGGLTREHELGVFDLPAKSGHSWLRYGLL